VHKNITYTVKEAAVVEFQVYLMFQYKQNTIIALGKIPLGRILASTTLATCRWIDASERFSGTFQTLKFFRRFVNTSPSSIKSSWKFF